ncbi:MAG: DEAD/DEAH box helicase [Alphaproteobacteria bacterium]|nr:DEAD/DEAH box helicase [Alphaproteobacteria bacterium]
MDFKELGLTETTIKAINEAGISVPTTVQSDVIPSILAGKDVFAIAPAGCGKTCSYVFPLIDIIARHEAQNILVITANSKQSVIVSDRFAVFNKYHEISETALTDKEENVNDEANVIIASPSLLVDLLKEDKLDLSNINILVVDDINLIKKLHQLQNLEQVLEVLPADKQNIVFTNRRSKETQDILDKILKTPAEIKIDRAKEQEAVQNESALVAVEEESVKTIAKPVAEKAEQATENKARLERKDRREQRGERRRNADKREENPKDSEAMSLMRKFHTFGRRTPDFLLTKVELADDNQ